jgi:hypothetical protein
LDASNLEATARVKVMRPANRNLFLSDEAGDELIIQRELANALRRSFEAVIVEQTPLVMGELLLRIALAELVIQSAAEQEPKEGH